MKYRIVERKWSNGEKYYLIQYRVLWLWLSYKMNEVYVQSHNCQNIFRRKIAFGDIEEAKEALERTQRNYEYSGIRIYPTTDKSVFYSLFKAKRHEKYGWYVNLIRGSYDSCCKQIDEYLAAKKNRKYKKDNRNMTTNILLTLIAVLLLARIVLQVWQGKTTLKRAYATASEVEQKAVVVPCSLVKMNNILTHMAMNKWELVGACAGEDDTLLFFFTRKKIKNYYDGKQ